MEQCKIEERVKYVIWDVTVKFGMVLVKKIFEPVKFSSIRFGLIITIF